MRSSLRQASVRTRCSLRTRGVILTRQASCFGFVTCGHYEAATVDVSEMAVAARGGPLVEVDAVELFDVPDWHTLLSEHATVSLDYLVGDGEERRRDC
jgi:hypothetical protein